MKAKTRKPIDALEARLKNRRVTAYLMPGGSIQFVTKRLDGRDVVRRGIRLSPEAVAAMYALTLKLQAKHPEVFPGRDNAF